jgi:hypothetical protein
MKQIANPIDRTWCRPILLVTQGWLWRSRAAGDSFHESLLRLSQLTYTVAIMASDFQDDRPDADPVSMTEVEARAALGEFAQDRATLAARIITPWWYHPALGVITGVFAGAHALPDGWPVVAIAAGIVAIPILSTTYARRYGVAVSKPAGPRGRRLMLAVLAVLVAGMASSLAFKFLGLEPWWGIIPAVITFVATIILGRRYDDALRQEIAVPRGALA